jgi:esterase/lipase
VDDLTTKVTEQRQVKADAEEKNRALTQTNASRKAKKEWIEKTYNYHENVEQLKLDVFNQIKETNNDVNKQVEEFTKKLQEVQQKFKTIK